MQICPPTGMLGKVPGGAGVSSGSSLHTMHVLHLGKLRHVEDNTHWGKAGALKLFAVFLGHNRERTYSQGSGPQRKEEGAVF